MMLTRLAYRPLLQQHGQVLVGQCILRWPVMGCMVVLPLLAVCLGWSASMPLVLSPFAAPTGLLLMAYACWLFWRSQQDVLLANEVRGTWPGGVYRHIRHPLYAALWLAALAQLLLWQDVLIGGGGILALLLLYGPSVRREEGLMLRGRGEAYRHYMQHTGRLWPRDLAA
ncbi:isoprenylcysteine carboxylmethyltransferase family protein [Aquitalea sp. LB_tupeE]|uniref:isoprenylcysteine carboxylmethyltransferase family protein n=1 Tax=Aquitalea sp. LB_tupeE TaxID=2748078 RepID=UPI0015BB9652|nr:isoprenylcysteine carboxylmethyltransferase family protein [Aquitalea sp. LB_tupeE]NWK79294.1 isoprenylcysteine carboxylmethyltransferase family protein [Aquitalea sp. LB_tupeE]